MPNEPAKPECLSFLFREATRYYDEGANDQEMSQVYEQMSCNYRRSALLKAKLVGENLNQAKAELKKANRVRKEKGKKPIRWIPLLKRKFGDERNFQNFMKIAEEWHRLEPELENNPNLSLDGALKLLRGKSRLWPEPSEEVKKRREVYREAQNMFRRVWPIWSDKEVEILHQGFVLCGRLDDDFLGWLRELMGRLS